MKTRYLFYIPKFESSSYNLNYGFSNGHGHDYVKSPSLHCYFCNKSISLVNENLKTNFRISFNYERGAWLYLDCCGEEHKKTTFSDAFIVKFNTNSLLEEFVAYSKKVMIL